MLYFSIGALRDFIQFKDQQIKNGVVGICGSGGNANRALSPNTGLVGVVGGSLTTGSALNNNYDYDFTSDDHIEEQNIGILNSNNSNIKENNDTVNQSVNNQTNTLEDENLVQKIQQSLEIFKKAKTENIAWVTRLQSKKIFFSLLFYVD